MPEHFPIDTASFWKTAPEYDSLEFWKVVTAQKGKQDAYSRELLVYGWGACGPILCTREYAQARLAQARGRDVADRRIAALKVGSARSVATRRANEAEKGARIRAILDRALARLTPRAGEG